MPIRQDSGARILTHAQFFGFRRNQREIPGFSIASMRADPALEVERHTHETAHFIVLLSGEYLTAARGAASVCVGPAIIYNPPGTTHRDTFRRLGAPTEARLEGHFVSVAIDATHMQDLAKQVALVEEPIYIEHAHAVGLGVRLAREMRCWSDSSPLVSETLCTELVAEIDQTTLDTRPSGRPEWLRAARDLLHDCCVEGASLAEIARECDVHPVHLARTFRRFLDCSPGDYIRLCRVERAATLLAETTTPLSEVALRCGYADQSHFNNVFRRAYASTPAQYRRMVRGDSS